MTSQVAVASKLVDDNLGPLARSLAMTHQHPVVAAVSWIVKNRRQPDGKEWSLRKLSEAAGQSPQWLEQVTSDRVGSINPDGIGLLALIRLAKAGQIRLDWLMTGQGSPELDSEPLIEFEDQFPSRADQIAFLAAAGAPRVVLERMRSKAYAKLSADPGRGFWLEEFQRLFGEFKQASKLIDVGDELEAARAEKLKKPVK